MYNGSWNIEADTRRRGGLLGHLPARLTPAVLWILGITCGVFVVQVLLQAFAPGVLIRFEDRLGLTPGLFLTRLHLWQPFTYLFLHSLSQPLHILFNMLVLYFAGPAVEGAMRTRRFVTLYFVCGLGAGLAHCALDYHHPVIGASGAILGVIAAFGYYFPNTIIRLFFVLPIRARNFIWVIAGLDLLLGLGGLASNVAVFAHLGGLFTGYAFVRYEWHVRGLILRQRARWHQRRVERDIAARQRVEELLGKVHRVGLHGLTRREKAFLKRASKRYRRDDSF